MFMFLNQKHHTHMSSDDVIPKGVAVTGLCGVEGEGAQPPPPISPCLSSASLLTSSPCAVLDSITPSQRGWLLPSWSLWIELSPKGPMPSWACAVLPLSIVSKSSSFS